MNYNQFKESVEIHMKERFPKEEYEVSIRRVTKNNGMVLDGLCIFKNGVDTSPTIYLEPYYEQYKNGAILADILECIQNEYKSGMRVAPSFQVSESNYELVRSQVIMRLVNYEKNAEILEECPHIRFHDLAITFRWLAYQDDIGISTALITFKDLERWKIHKNRLFLDASMNTPRIFPSKVARLKDIMEAGGMCLEHMDVELYIITNEQGMNGATCILYQDLLNKVADQIGGDYYLLPSSIHEMMVCPATEEVDYKMLLTLVKDANHMVVTMGEILSDNIYFYDKEQKVLSFIKQPNSNS